MAAPTLHAVDHDLVELTRRFHRAEERFDYEQCAWLSGEIDRLLELRDELAKAEGTS